MVYPGPAPIRVVGSAAMQDEGIVDGDAAGIHLEDDRSALHLGVYEHLPFQHVAFIR